MDAHLLKLIEEKATTNELFTLADMSTTRMWNYELPTLTKRSRFTSRQPWNSCEEFAEAFLNQFPIFKDIDMSNLAVMGGSVFDLLHCRESRVADIDIFIVGDIPSEEQQSVDGTTLTLDEWVLKRAERFIDDIYAHVAAHVQRKNEAEEKNGGNTGGRGGLLGGRGGFMYSRARGGIVAMPVLDCDTTNSKITHTSFINKLKATRNGPVLTFSIPTISVPIQLVLSAHRTVPDLLRRVDLDCTGIAFVEKKNLYFSPMAKFCFENSCAVVSNIRGHGYEERLSKYFDKGMDVILPLLDMSTIPRRNLKYKVEEVIDLKSMAIVYSEIVGTGKIITTRLVRTKSKRAAAEAEARKADSDAGFNAASEEEDDTEEGNTEHDGGAGTAMPVVAISTYKCGEGKGLKEAGTIIHENLVHLLHGLPQRFQFYGEGKFLKDVLLPIPKLTQRMITNSFETVRSKVEESLKSDHALIIRTFERYFTVKPTSQIVSELVVAPLLEREAARRSASAAAKNTTNNNGNDTDKNSSAESSSDVMISGVPTLFDDKYSRASAKYLDALIEAQVRRTNEALAALEADHAAHPERYRVVADMPFEKKSTKNWYGDKYTKK